MRSRKVLALFKTLSLDFSRNSFKVRKHLPLTARLPDTSTDEGQRDGRQDRRRSRSPFTRTPRPRSPSSKTFYKYCPPCVPLVNGVRIWAPQVDPSTQLMGFPLLHLPVSRCFRIDPSVGVGLRVYAVIAVFSNRLLVAGAW